MYSSSAALARDIVGSGYGISGLRTFYGAATTGTLSTGACVKIKGHQHFPNQTHTDPGVNWNWEYFYTLVNNAPTISTLTAASGSVYDPGGASANYADDVRQCQLIAPTGATSVTLTFSSFDVEASYDHLLVFDGANNQAPLLGKFSGTTSPGTLTASSGKMFLEFRSDCATNRPGFVASWTSTVPSSCPTDSYEANETLAAGKAIGVNVNNLAYVCPATDVDWYKFTSSSTNNNIKITLTTLPADYDLELYSASGTLLYSSTLAGTNSETITYNGAPAATYYVKVYGYNGATSSTAYTLRISTQSTAWRAASGAVSMAQATRSEALSAPIITIANPVEAGAKAWLTVSGYDGPTELLLRDLRGQQVSEATKAAVVSGEPLGYAVPAGLRPGLYMMALQLGSRLEYVKLLVQ